MKRSAIKSLVQSGLGLVVSWLLTRAIFGVSGEFAGAVSLLFFCASYVRQVAIEEAFRRLWKE